MIVKFISKIWVLNVKVHLKTITDFLKTLITNFVPLIIEKKIDTMKFKKDYSILFNLFYKDSPILSTKLKRTSSSYPL